MNKDIDEMLKQIRIRKAKKSHGENWQQEYERLEEQAVQFRAEHEQKMRKREQTEDALFKPLMSLVDVIEANRQYWRKDQYWWDDNEFDRLDFDGGFWAIVEGVEINNHRGTRYEIDNGKASARWTMWENEKPSLEYWAYPDDLIEWFNSGVKVVTV